MSELRRDFLLLDSNLLLLLVVGGWNPRAIPFQERLNQFTIADFEILRIFVSTFKKIVTTTHILTEVSNLAGAATGSSRDAIFRQLAAVIATADERLMPSNNICVQPEFQPFGLTDAALSVLASEMLLLTADGRLARHLQLKSLNAWTLAQVKDLREQTNNL